MLNTLKIIACIALAGLGLLSYNPRGEPSKPSDEEWQAEYIETQNSRLLYELRELRRDVDFNDDEATTKTKNKVLRFRDPGQSCKEMFRVLAQAKEAALALNNTNYPWVNWVRNTFSGWDINRSSQLSSLSFANDLVYHAGGGATGYFWRNKTPFDPDNSPNATNAVYDAHVKSFKINEGNGASCDLNDW